MSVHDNFIQIEREMNQVFFERRDVIRGLLVGLLARQHVLLLGPPGTAKSALVEDLCRRIGGRYFRWLLARTSTPEELFGPVSLRALEQDSYRRVTTGKLPEATIAFLDEIFKANSAILNSLLSVLNERLFYNDGAPVKAPLEMCVAASNELPEDRDELEALWDRFMLRYVVSYIKDPANFDRLLADLNSNPGCTSITAEELAQAQAEVRAVDAAAVIPKVAALRQKLSAEAGITVSDRRWRQSLDLIRAHAWLEGRATATDDDLVILVPALWQEPGQVVQVKQIVLSMASPLDYEAQDLQDQAQEVYGEAIARVNSGDDTSVLTKIGLEANAKFKTISVKLARLREQAEAQGKGTAQIDAAIKAVNDFNTEIIKKCMGIDI